MLDWAGGLGEKLTFAIEGTGSYGAGLTSAVQRRDIGVVEVMRTDRRDRRLRGKSDTLDAENAAVFNTCSARLMKDEPSISHAVSIPPVDAVADSTSPRLGRWGPVSDPRLGHHRTDAVLSVLADDL